MKIKTTALEIVQGDILKLSADALIVEGKLKAKPAKAQGVITAEIAGKNGAVTQESLRRAVSGALEQAMKAKAGSVVVGGLGANAKDFPVAGAAKILAQEILKAARFGKNAPKKIVVCLDNAALFKTYDTTIRGYVTHIQDDLGQGPYVTVDIIIELPEGIILIERSNPPYGWALPGGFLDYGESLEDCARREAKEETNMELVDLRQFHTYSDPKRDPRFHTVSTVFIAKGKGKPQFGDDAKGLKVIPYAELLKRDYAFDHKQVISDYLSLRKK